MKKIVLNANTAFAVYNFRFGLMKALEKEGYEIICLGNKDNTSELIEKNGWKYFDTQMGQTWKKYSQ